MTEPIMISVLMTAYNRERFIGEAIESVLASSYPHFELIIVDDASEDKTVSIAQSYAAIDKRIRLFVNEQNLGDYRNRNKAASYAQGIYLKYLDSDDVIMPWGLELMIYGMMRFPESSIGFSSNHPQNIIYPKLLSPLESYRAYYYKNSILSVGPSAAIIKKSTFDQMNGFNGEKFIGDIELWLRIAQKSPVVCLPPGLIYWRKHEDQEIKKERHYHQIQLRRFLLDHDFLQAEESPIASAESDDILQNLRNIKTRNALLNFFSGNFNTAIVQFRLFNLGFTDVLNACKKNKVL